jgi:hypothetical protein
MTQFDYSAYCRRLQGLKKLQIPQESVCWTELLFLDEATAFAAGHRLCAYGGQKP